MHPNEKAIERLRGSDRWAVTTLRCEQATVSGAGTRSQTLTLRATVLQTTDPQVPSPLNLEQYVTDDTILVAPNTYLAILAGIGKNDDPVAWSIVQRSEIKGADAAAETARLKLEVESKLKQP